MSKHLWKRRIPGEVGAFDLPIYTCRSEGGAGNDRMAWRKRTEVRRKCCSPVMGIPGKLHAREVGVTDRHNQLHALSTRQHIRVGAKCVRCFATESCVSVW